MVEELHRMNTRTGKQLILYNQNSLSPSYVKSDFLFETFNENYF